MGRPKAPTIAMISSKAGISSPSFKCWLDDRRNVKIIVHRLEATGYTKVRNDSANDGLWKIDGRRQAAYSLADLSVRERLAAVQTL
jgi:hypothetical protein